MAIINNLPAGSNEEHQCIRISFGAGDQWLKCNVYPVDDENQLIIGSGEGTSATPVYVKVIKNDFYNNTSSYYSDKAYLGLGVIYSNGSAKYYGLKILAKDVIVGSTYKVVKEPYCYAVYDMSDNLLGKSTSVSGSSYTFKYSVYVGT